MTIDEILEQWANDSQYNKLDIGEDSIKIAKLHHKYISMLTTESIILMKSKADYNKLYKLRWQYYSGVLDQETLVQYNWSPMKLKILKSDVSTYLDADEQLESLKIKITTQELKISTIDSIMKMIKDRNFHIKNYIDYERFKVGAI